MLFAQLLRAVALADRLGLRLMLTVSLALWSLARAFGDPVGSFGQVFGARVLLFGLVAVVKIRTNSFAELVPSAFGSCHHSRPGC